MRIHGCARLPQIAPDSDLRSAAPSHAPAHACPYCRSPRFLGHRSSRSSSSHRSTTRTVATSTSPPPAFGCGSRRRRSSAIWIICASARATSAPKTHTTRCTIRGPLVDELLALPSSPSARAEHFRAEHGEGVCWARVGMHWSEQWIYFARPRGRPSTVGVAEPVSRRRRRTGEPSASRDRECA